jgi:Predicted pPIWI-associating nuclease
MLESVRTLVERIRRLDKDVRPLVGKQVFKNAIRNDAREIVDVYFREHREPLLSGGLSNLSDLDAGMHNLLEVAQRNSTAAKYRATLKKLDGCLRQAEKQALMSGSSGATAHLEPVDKLILATLSGFLPSAARSYEQAMSDLRSGARLSWRGPATDLREALRETLDHLAPDEQVLGEPGFKLEKDTTGPTMKQKVRHILRKRGVGKSAMQSPESATQAVDEIVGTFVRGVYTRSSISSHTPTDRAEILRIRDWVRVALCELLEVRVGA